MERVLRSRNGHRLARASVFLLIVALIAGMAGCDGYTPLPPSQNLEIRDWYDLDAVRDNLEGHHVLMNDLNSTAFGYVELASATANGGTGWEPIGHGYFVSGLGLSGEYFRGSFDGQGHEIRDLFINRPNYGIGLFGCVGGAGIVKNVRVINATVTVPDEPDAIMTVNEGTVGILDVSPIWGVGILAGLNTGSLSNSYASGTVNGDDHVGGLVGDNRGALSESYVGANVSGQLGSVGGLVGFNAGTIANSCSTSNVTGHENVGGLVGRNWKGAVRNSYSTGSVAGSSNVGGLIGYTDDATVKDSFWDIETSGQTMSDGGTGQSSAQMQNIITFSGAGWNIIAVALNETNSSYIWNIVNNVTYPFLSWQSI